MIPTKKVQTLYEKTKKELRKAFQEVQDKINNGGDRRESN
jgi:hypothetical protein